MEYLDAWVKTTTKQRRSLLSFSRHVEKSPASVYQSGSYKRSSLIWLPENVMPPAWSCTEILILAPARTCCETVGRPRGCSEPQALVSKNDGLAGSLTSPLPNYAATRLAPNSETTMAQSCRPFFLEISSLRNKMCILVSVYWTVHTCSISWCKRFSGKSLYLLLLKCNNIRFPQYMTCMIFLTIGHL